jgi:hypothetical protein
MLADADIQIREMGHLCVPIVHPAPPFLSVFRRTQVLERWIEFPREGSITNIGLYILPSSLGTREMDGVSTRRVYG